MPKLVATLAILIALVTSASAQPLPPNPGTGLPPITSVDATFRNLGSTVLVPGQCITVGGGTTHYLQSTGSACGSGGGGGGISAGVGIVLTGGGTIVNLISPVSAALGGTGLNSPTAHSLLITEGASPMNLLSCLSNQAMFGVTGFDPTCRAISLADLPNSGVTPGSYTNSSITVNAQGIVTAAANGSGGGGSVSSVGLTVPSYESVSGSPVTGAGTLAVSLNNENAHLFFAGPVSGSATTPTFRTTDPSDLLGSSINPANDGSTGTTINKLASLTSAAAAIITSASAGIGAVGICIQNCGTTGNSYVQQNGQANCVFDGATTANDAVGISTTVNGDCTDLGSPQPSAVGEIIGTVTTTNVGAGTYNVNLFTPDLVQAAAVASTSTVLVANDLSTGTTLHRLAVYNTSGNPQAVLAATSSLGPFVGIVNSGAGTSGFATIQTSGSATCTFDGATTNKDAVVASITVAGECHDAGSATPNTTSEVLGTVVGTHGAGGNFQVNLQLPWATVIGGQQVCDKSILSVNNFHLFFLSNGSGASSFCNNQNTPTLQGVYRWQSQQIFLGGNVAVDIQGDSHLSFFGGGAGPTVSSCGGQTVTNANSSGSRGSVTVGATGPPSACTLTFVSAFTKGYCWAQDDSNFVMLKVTTPVTSAMTITGASSIGGDTINYGCDDTH